MDRSYDKNLPNRLGIVTTCILLVCCLNTPLAARTTIEFLYLADAVWESAYKALSDRFELANDDIRVERMSVQSAYADRLIASLAAGTLPDVVGMDMNYIMSFGTEEILVDLNPLIGRTPDYRIDRVARPLLDIYTVDGKLFAAPIVANPSAYFFNEGLFGQAALPSPIDLYRRDAWTWSAFRDAARKLTRKDPTGQYTVVGASLHLPRTWMASNGGAEFDDPKRPTTTCFESEASKEALHFIRAMVLETGACIRSDAYHHSLVAMIL